MLASSGACWSIEHLDHLDGLIFGHTLAEDPRFSEIFSKDAWSAMVTAHEAGRQEMLQKLGDKVVSQYVENVPEGPDSERVLRDLYNQGKRSQ